MPAGTLVQVNAYGAVVSVATTVVPLQELDPRQLPFRIGRRRARSIVAGAVKVAPFAGLVSVTVGGPLGP